MAESSGLKRVLFSAKSSSETLLSENAQEKIRDEINILLNNSNTQIGKQGVSVITEKHLRDKSIYILTDGANVTQGMYSEVKDYLGNSFSLHVGQLSLPKMSATGSFGKELCTSIEYTNMRPVATIGLLFVLFVVGLYITPMIYYLGGTFGLFQTEGWVTTIIVNGLATIIMFGMIQLIRAIKRINIMYNVYVVEMQVSTQLMIGLVGSLLYCVVCFILHTRSDSSMFGSLFRLMGY